MKFGFLISDAEAMEIGFKKIREIVEKMGYGKVQVELKKRRKQRSNPQNSLMWVRHQELVNFIAITQGVIVEPTEWHYEYFLPHFAPRFIGEIKLPNGDSKPIPVGSSEWGTMEFIDVMERYNAYYLDLTGQSFDAQGYEAAMV